ncbi:hypothetical protein [Flavobacterium psychraquaticum]|uniref:hypothetical protein n=1 Tax=Flavobacterium psychraquaticum TaxID=3103958 RepID=UPI002ACDC827|nr:hypothetical protein [Flavobacterium sp. LB-N7T]
MENSTLLDVRTVFLNMVLFGAKTTPELLIDSCTSDDFINLLDMDDGTEKDTFFRKISIEFLLQLNVMERINLIDILSTNETYNQFLYVIYMLTNKDKKQTEGGIKIKICEDLMEYKNNGLITDSVLAYFRVMLDRLILFDFNKPGMINKSEYMKISTQLLSNNMGKYFLEN